MENVVDKAMRALLALKPENKYYIDSDGTERVMILPCA